jgi:Lon protease-like protein
MTTEMSANLEELPLFLLNTVLFPYAHIRLHVFEERYKALINECIRHQRPFGIVLIRAGDEVGGNADPYLVGTAVKIEQVDYLDDGCMDIQVHGERRFRIRQIDESGPYLTGFVEPVVELDIQDQDVADSVIVRARQEFETLIRRLFSQQEFNIQIEFPTDPEVLSFTIANLLSMENLDKQRLLETTDTVERVEALIPILQLQTDELRRPTAHRVSSIELQEWITPN